MPQANRDTEACHVMGVDASSKEDTERVLVKGVWVGFFNPLLLRSSRGLIVRIS